MAHARLCRYPATTSLVCSRPLFSFFLCTIVLRVLPSHCLSPQRLFLPSFSSPYVYFPLFSRSTFKTCLLFFLVGPHTCSEILLQNTTGALFWLLFPSQNDSNTCMICPSFVFLMLYLFHQRPRLLIPLLFFLLID